MSNSCVHSRARAPLADARAPVMSDDVARDVAAAERAREPSRALAADDDAWRAHYDALLEWSTADGRDGSCNAPWRATHRGLAVGAWLQSQRAKMRANKMRGDRMRKMEALTTARRLWIDAPGRAGWREQLERLAAWAEKNNGGTDYNAPVGATHEGAKVGAWLATQRTRRRDGENARRPLKPEQTAALDALVARGVLRCEKADSWPRKWALVLKWGEEKANGEHFNVPYDYADGGERVGVWLNTQRQRFRGGTTKNTELTPWQREQMQAMIDAGKLWVHAPDDVWEKKFALLLRWGKEKTQGFHYNVPQGEEYEGVKLGMWLSTQRSRLLRETLGKNRPLSDDERRKLQKLIDDGRLRPSTPRGANAAKRQAKRAPRGNLDDVDTALNIDLPHTSKKGRKT